MTPYFWTIHSAWRATQRGRALTQADAETDARGAATLTPGPDKIIRIYSGCPRCRGMGWIHAYPCRQCGKTGLAELINTWTQQS